MRLPSDLLNRRAGDMHVPLPCLLPFCVCLRGPELEPDQRSSSTRHCESLTQGMYVQTTGTSTISVLVSYVKRELLYLQQALVSPHYEFRQTRTLCCTACCSLVNVSSVCLRVCLCVCVRGTAE